MANTLVEYGYLSLDTLIKGIARTIVKDCPLFEKLPFEEIVGNSVKYNLESAEAGAQFVAVGDTIPESTPVWAQRTVSLAQLIGDADVDHFAKLTRSSINDIEAEVVALKAKAIRDRFLKELVVGKTTTTPDANGFKGLLQLLAECESDSAVDLDGINNTQVVLGSATSAVLSLAMVDELIDAVKGGKPDFLMGSKRSRRKVSSLARAGGANLTFATTELGNQIALYNGIPWLDNDFILDNYQDGAASVLAIASYVQSTTRAATLDNSPIFAFRVGSDGVVGLWTGGIMVTPLGELSTKNAIRHRIKMYAAIKLGNTRAASVLINATDGTIA